MCSTCDNLALQIERVKRIRAAHMDQRFLDEADKYLDDLEERLRASKAAHSKLPTVSARPPDPE